MQRDRYDLPRWGFAEPGPLRDKLTALALAGTKTTTAGLLVEYELDGDAVPSPGDRQVVVGSADEPVAIVETVTSRVVRLADVDDRHAIDEGEGWANAAEFRAAHEGHWNGFLDTLRARLGEPSFAIGDETQVVLERFRVVARLDAAQGPVAIRPAEAAEVPALAGVLARAFAADPMVCWPLITLEDLGPRIRTMFEAIDGRLAAEGWMHVAADGLGAMALLPSGREAVEQQIDAETAPVLAALTPDGGARVDAFWTWVTSMLPDEPHWLLDQLAVEPAAQGRGIGGAMIRHATATAAEDGLPLLLETGVASNVGLYRRFGFRVIAEGDAPDGGPHVWFLRRDPDGPASPA